jgi:hypothetical protein
MMFQFSKPELINYSKATERSYKTIEDESIYKKNTEMPIIRHELLHAIPIA